MQHIKRKKKKKDIARKDIEKIQPIKILICQYQGNDEGLSDSSRGLKRGQSVGGTLSGGGKSALIKWFLAGSFKYDEN